VILADIDGVLAKKTAGEIRGFRRRIPEHSNDRTGGGLACNAPE
jgi:hypothetical protein